MDLGDPPHTPVEEGGGYGEEIEPIESPKKLPDDLPTSLDDRRRFDDYGGETEIYDAWQGQSQFLTNPVPAKPLAFNLGLDSSAYEDEEATSRLQDSDTRLMNMLAAQAAHRSDPAIGEDEETIAADPKIPKQEKRDILQKTLNMAASNGDVEKIKRLVNGKAKDFVDVNMPDEEGTVPLIYASCFGHEEVVATLLAAGAQVDKQDHNQWSPLMWAMTNRHKGIAKILLDHGASPEIKSSSGGTAFDFVQPGSEFSKYLHENGYHIGNETMQGDFYDSGFAQDRFEEEMAENEIRRRMLMQESAANLEVDLSTLGFDEQPESPTELEEEQEEFIWERCVGDQMFVFQEGDLDRILDLIITHMTPQRSPSQKPVPANLLFLMARYAHYHMTEPLLEELLLNAMDRINDVVERHQWDMTILAFWISNATLLLHYLKKDHGLVEATPKFQLELAELINEIFILIIRDAERRMNRVLEPAMLDHETIPGFEDVEFQGEWKILKRSKPKHEEPPEKRFRPPSPKRRAQTSPRNITSLLSSALFVLDLYDVHSVITTQILAQLLYWLGAELFNHIMLNRRYLSRTKAMQIRMNISQLEDWARSNNRQPEHYENGATSCTGENTVQAARRHLAPVIQMLQWLQCFSSLGEDNESLRQTLLQLRRLSPTQLIHAVKQYRQEVGEKSLPKVHMRFLVALEKDQASIIDSSKAASTTAASSVPSTPMKTQRPSLGNGESPSTPEPPTNASKTSLVDEPLSASKNPPTSLPSQHTVSSTTNKSASPETSSLVPASQNPTLDPSLSHPDEDDGPTSTGLSKSKSTSLNPALMLPFSLPTSTDMLITYGAGFGGTNRERERKYIPTVPPEWLTKLGVE